MDDSIEQLTDMQGKVCLVTGATSGIGNAAALALARLHATVVLVGLDPAECLQVTESIRSKTNNPEVHHLAADLSIQQEIHRICDEFKRHFSRLDLLINNAGAVFLNRQQTEDGIEKTFALNHLSYFLLTNLLMDLLVASAPSRIINVTSAIHEQASLDFDDLQNRRGYNGVVAYSRSKLANVIFTYELANRLWGTGVTANALHPGYVSSNLGKNNAGFLKPLINWIHLGGSSPEEAARSILYLACSPKVNGITGRYFVKEKLSISQVRVNHETARRLWEVSASMAGIGSPAV